MVDSFSYLSVLHDWRNKGIGMYYPVCRMIHMKEHTDIQIEKQTDRHTDREIDQDGLPLAGLYLHN